MSQAAPIDFDHTAHAAGELCDDEHSPSSAPVTEADERVVERAAALLRAMGDSGRLRVLERLSRRELCVSELASASGEGLSTVSQRLRTLRSEGLVARRREGKHIYYRLADAHVVALIETVLEHAGEDISGG